MKLATSLRAPIFSAHSRVTGSVPIEDVLEKAKRNAGRAPLRNLAGLMWPSVLTAIEYVKSHNVTAALLDVDMPGLSGIEVAELMCRINPRLNVIFVTGYPEYALQAFTVPVSDFILKPVSEEALRASFQKLRFPPEENVDEAFIYSGCQGCTVIGHSTAWSGFGRVEV